MHIKDFCINADGPKGIQLTWTRLRRSPNCFGLALSLAIYTVYLQGNKRTPKQEFSKRESSNMELSVPDMNIHWVFFVVV